MNNWLPLLYGWNIADTAPNPIQSINKLFKQIMIYDTLAVKQTLAIHRIVYFFFKGKFSEIKRFHMNIY